MNAAAAAPTAIPIAKYCQVIATAQQLIALTVNTVCRSRRWPIAATQRPIKAQPIAATVNQRTGFVAT